MLRNTSRAATTALVTTALVVAGTGSVLTQPASATEAHSPPAAAESSTPHEARLRGELVFSNAAGSNWFVAKGDFSSSLNAPFAVFAATESALPTGDEWTTPVIGDAGPLMREDRPGRCLTDRDTGLWYDFESCSGKPDQQFEWTTVGDAQTLRNVATARFVSTGALEYGYSDLLQGGTAQSAAAPYDMSRLQPDDGGDVTPPANGGVDAQGLGFPSTVPAGGRATVHVGLHVDQEVTALRQTTVTLDAPAGTTFDRSQTVLDGELRPSVTGAWGAVPGARIQGSVSPGGRSFTGTIADAGSDFRAPTGAELRWGITVIADAAAS